MNTQNKHIWSTLGAFAFLLSCAQSGAVPPPDPVESDRNHHGQLPPLTLVLDGQRTSGGLIDLKATLDLQHSHKISITLDLELPTGAVLVKGLAPEVLTPPHPATLTRSFQVRVSSDAPIRVRAHQSIPGVLGVVAQKEFPAAAPPPVPVPKGIKPVNIGGLVIDRAIPLPAAR
jgi:hypothetical protein